ncbi:MAG: hypothetical protein A2Y33_10535 [Spirochaetes bacterium GWF1_51_8]|nr:MAG: hypothetical protein A2Y33_10535 [Spirochaetes bacterium GWF1_51_8]
MKRTIMGVCFLLSVLLLGAALPATAGAATLHAVLICEDDYDNAYLNNIADSVRVDYENMEKFVDILAGMGILKVKKIVVKGSDATYQGIVDALNGLTKGVDKDDVVLVHFAGHGGMTGGKTFLATADDKYLYRDDMEKLVKAIPVRLKLVFTDACSSSIDALKSMKKLAADPDEDREAAIKEMYKNLFLNYEGLLYATGASEGEYAWGGGEGGSYTYSLVVETLIQDPKTTWKEVHDQSAKKTQEKFDYMVKVGALSQNDLKDLKKKGITGQHPKAYSMPALKKSGKVEIDKVVIADDKTDQKQMKHNIEILNNVDKDVTFYIDKNKNFGSGWSDKNTEKKTFKPGEVIQLKDDKPIKLYYIAGSGAGYKKYFELAKGKFEFVYDRYNVMQLYKQGTQK